MEDRIEHFKGIVDSIFKSLDDTESKIKDKIGTGGIRKRLDPKRVEEELDKEIIIDDNSNMAEECLQLALDELETVRAAFLEFQEKVEDLAIFQFIYPQVEEFVDFCLDLIELMENDFDVNSLTGESLKKYQKIQKLRARILSAIYMKYRKE